MKTTEETAGVNLAGRLTIWGVEDLRKILLDELDKGGDLVLSLAPHDEIDAAGFQLLAAAGKSAVKRNRKLTVQEPLPAYFTDWMTRAGLDITDITGGGDHE